MIKEIESKFTSNLDTTTRSTLHRTEEHKSVLSFGYFRQQEVCVI